MLDAEQVAKEIGVNADIVYEMIQCAADVFQPLWEDEPLDMDQTKMLVDLLLVTLDWRNGNL